MRLDFHTHVGPFADDRSLDELLSMLDAHGMDCAVALPSRGLRGSPSVYARANEYVAEAMQRHPRRVVGFCTVNPWHAEEALREFERSVRHLGLRGLKLHPPTQGYDVADHEIIDPLLALAASVDVPVVIHGGLRVHDNPLRFALLAQAHPGVRVVMLHANFGGTDRVGVRWAAQNAPNLFFETSATNEPAFIAELAGWAGTERIFFGSDWPWLPPRLERAMVECSGLAEAQIDAILGGSAARFLGIAA